jgi:hypothetical protein
MKVKTRESGLVKRLLDDNYIIRTRGDGNRMNPLSKTRPISDVSRFRLGLDLNIRQAPAHIHILRLVLGHRQVQVSPSLFSQPMLVQVAGW